MTENANEDLARKLLGMKMPDWLAKQIGENYQGMPGTERKRNLATIPNA